MTVYIASSWKNQHAVELLTARLRQQGHTVRSFIENRGKEEHGSETGAFDLDAWVASDEGAEKFENDTDGATKSDRVIYIGPSGTDAWAEVGAAWGAGVPVLGLWAKGEPAGLMRRMVAWARSADELLAETARWPASEVTP